jgi:hypothetical protein
MFVEGVQGIPTIYWADEDGEYDSSRYTLLVPGRSDGLGNICSHMLPYVAKLTSDTVDDIVLSVLRVDSIVLGVEKTYMCLFKGGEQLYQRGKVSTWDDSAFWLTDGGGARAGTVDSLDRTYGAQGDFRGVGREDFVAGDDLGNLYYFKNDVPFDIHKFAGAMRSDTLVRMRDYSLSIPATPLDHDFRPKGILAMRVFPKPVWDNSVDLLVAPSIVRDSTYQSGVCIWRGGPHFGEKRLGYDSCDFLIHHPAYYNYAFQGITWPSLQNGGDLTGTGNPVLITGGGGGLGNQFYAWYVLGRALDDKIDMFVSYYHGSGWADTITATNSGYRSFIESTPYAETSDDNGNQIAQVGGIQMLVGARNIPVHPNPVFSVSGRHSLDTSVHHLLAYPNPCDERTVITFDNCSGGTMQVDVINMLGTVVRHNQTPGGFGVQQFAVALNELPAGAYVIRLSCPADGWSATTSVIKAGTAETPWSLNLHEVVGH